MANLIVLTEGGAVRWDVEPGSDNYDVLRGSLTALRTERDFRSATCLADGIAAASLDDPADPAVSGEGFFYLVRGAAGSAAECRRDTYGTTLRDITGLACR